MIFPPVIGFLPVTGFASFRSSILADFTVPHQVRDKENGRKHNSNRAHPRGAFIRGCLSQTSAMKILINERTDITITRSQLTLFSHYLFLIFSSFINSAICSRLIGLYLLASTPTSYILNPSSGSLAVCPSGKRSAYCFIKFDAL